MAKNKNKIHRRDVYIACKFTCQYCGLRFPVPSYWNGEALIHPWETWGNVAAMFLEIDHINPISKGGSDEIGNKQALCSRCNNKKSDKILKQNG